MPRKIVEAVKNAMKLAQSGETDGAIEHLELLEKLGLALNYARKVALARPQYQRIQFMLAGLLQRSGKIDEAKAAHEHCLQLCITNKDEELLELLNLNSESDLYV